MCLFPKQMSILYFTDQFFWVLRLRFIFHKPGKKHSTFCQKSWNNHLKFSLYEWTLKYLYLHFPSRCPIKWFGCASSHSPQSGPRLQGCTASLSSRTLAACPRDGRPACVWTTGTGCHRSRGGWGGAPAAPPALSSCCPPREWWGTVHLEREATYLKVTYYAKSTCSCLFYINMCPLCGKRLSLFVLIHFYKNLSENELIRLWALYDVITIFWLV